jgi:hypothetical protein
MIDSFDDRKKAYENKFVHSQELQFKIDARRRKMLALWAAENMGMGEEDSLNYALEIVKFGIEDTSNGAVINRIMNDAKEKGLELSEKDIRVKNNEFAEIATREVQQQQDN